MSGISTFTQMWKQSANQEGCRVLPQTPIGQNDFITDKSQSMMEIEIEDEEISGEFSPVHPCLLMQKKFPTYEQGLREKLSEIC